MNQFLLTRQYLENPQLSRFLPNRTNGMKSFSKTKTKSSKCPQYSEAAIGSDEFILDVLQFFFEERLNPNQLNDRLRQVAADAVWRATEGSDAMDMVPRPPGGKPGPVWIISQAVQIAFRKAQNRCIYEAVRIVVKAALRSEYEFAKNEVAQAQSFYVRQFANETISDQGIDFIKQFEAFRSNLYNDAVGHCTIGYGTLVHRGNCSGSEPDEFKSGISEERATELLRQEVGRIEGVINTSVAVSLSQSQFDSLVSFAYNVGTGAFKNSTLLKKLNQGDYAAVPIELKKWVKGGGKTLPGLVRRRAAEADMFTNGTYSTAKSLQATEQPFFDVRTCQQDQTFNTTWTKIKSQIVQIANQEFAYWTKPDNTRYKETDSYVTSRLQGYWSSTGLKVTAAQCQDSNWQNQNPWSAAFISWVMLQAGAGNSFNYAGAHMRYVYAAKQNTDSNNQDNPFWLCDVTNALPEPGDLICMNRGGSSFTYATVKPNGKSHSDVVVEVDHANNRIFVIGGNKNTNGNPGTVDKEEIRLTSNGLVDTSYGNQNKIFAVLKLRTDKCETCGTVAVV